MRVAPTFSPGLAVSAVAHLALIAALLMASAVGTGPPADPGPVAVRLASPSDLYAAQSAAAGPPAPEVEALEVEATAPEPAPIVEAAPQPTPEPQIPTPRPVPAPAARPATPPPPLQKTAAAKPAAQPAARPGPPRPAPPVTRQTGGGLDLEALATEVARMGGGRPGPAAATGPSAAALAGLQDQLQQRWTPNCEVEGGRDVRVRVSFGLATSGELEGPVEAGGLERSDNPTVRAAAERAIRAVHQAAPFTDLAGPSSRRFVVNFNAREACS